MPTLAETIDSIARHIGFPDARLRTLARRLQDADMLPSGAPGVPPVIEPRDALALIVAAASGATLRRAAESAVAYWELTPGGADVSDAPATVAKSAGGYLSAIAAIAAEGENWVRRLKIEISRNFPGVAIHHEDDTVQWFQPRGALSGHWGATGHHDSVVINGAAFADVFLELFGVSK